MRLHLQWNKFNVSEWLEYLEQRCAVQIQLGLTRVYAVAERMNLLVQPSKIITVAGTNGKGSTVAALEAIYHAAGYQVGAYTSPHLLTFNERIRVNTLPISDESLCQAFCAVEKSRGEIDLTYFEMATLASLWYYKEQKLDIIILEVGLGGRLDATNIIDSDLSIITTIDFDHQAYLGNTLEAIGYEKAGIMRADKPCIYADFDPPSSILAEVEKKKSTLFCLGKDYRFKEDAEHLIFECLNNRLWLPKPMINYKATAAALMACECLRAFLPIELESQQLAMQTVNVPGRLELHKGDIDILYDVSHNPQAVRLLLQYVKRLDCPGKVHAVFSALADKDLKGLIAPLRDCVDHWYPAQLTNVRATNAEILIGIFQDLDLDVPCIYSDPALAFNVVKSQANSGDLIIVYGSFYTVAAIQRAHALPS